LVDLTSTVNTLFSSNFSAVDVSNALFQAQGEPTGSNCASQSLVVDVAPGLNQETAPNRTAWAQAAILWNFVLSQDLTAATTLRSFAAKADWQKAGSSDGPTLDSSLAFAVNASGYTFDFASQTISRPDVSFVGSGQPSNTQLGEVNSIAQATLDRMYTFASGIFVRLYCPRLSHSPSSSKASSQQRTTALSIYWTSTLQQKADDLPTFLSLMAGAPVLIPFDLTSSPGNQPLANLLSNSSSTLFPPPLACYPGLNTSALSVINSVETDAFGLDTISSAASSFDDDCYGNRPNYGLLDPLQMRLPFADSDTGAPLQAGVLQRAATSRVILSVGRSLSGYPSLPSAVNVTVEKLDPSQYGTLNNMNHVVLAWLIAFENTTTAVAAIDYIMANPAVPPPQSSALLAQIPSIPAIEVAVFGNVSPQDISLAYSSFSTPSGSLFFGSDQGLALREWAIVGAGAEVVWTQNDTSSEVVRDKQFGDPVIWAVWNPASTFLHSNSTNVVVNVGNVTSSLQDLGKFTP
jgi:hypothetical protein